MPDQYRYGRFETWCQGALWHAETTDYFRNWAATGETEVEALAALAEKLLEEIEGT